MRNYFYFFGMTATTEQLKRFRDAHMRRGNQELAVMADSEIIYRELEGE